MSDELIRILFSGASAVLGAVVSAVVLLRRSRSEVTTTEVQRAAELYRDIIEGLRQDLDELMDKLESLENEHLKCREENATLRARLESLEEKIGL